MEIRNNQQIYHDTYSFTKKLRAIDTPELRQNLEVCLLGKADRWYMELSYTARLKLRKEIEQWCEALESRSQGSFRVQPDLFPPTAIY